jgi:hypothetical protein
VRIAFFIIGKETNCTSERGRGGSRSVFISAARGLDRRRVYDEAGNVIETHEHAGDFKEP